MRALTYSTLIGLLLVATGLRPGEAFRLDRSDVDLVNGIFSIRESKFGKSRFGPESPVATNRNARSRWAGIPTKAFTQKARVRDAPKVYKPRARSLLDDGLFQPTIAQVRLVYKTMPLTVSRLSFRTSKTLQNTYHLIHPIAFMTGQIGSTDF
ncbi:tyrosine-type recombinase/integrase [Burkholderia ubonensis]|uniref:tyrosine-type recombinase/integrase n=1 Tax=Burkholderia ubonensis TaxID=101571 RepID=UPI001E2D92A8|nr:tyrosine-type recombinase/integrase [Burkholderia ubonensis]